MREPRHAPHWPPGLSRHLTLPQTNVWYNAEVSAARYPDKPYIVFYGTTISFAEFRRQSERVAGYRAIASITDHQVCWLSNRDDAAR